MLAALLTLVTMSSPVSAEAAPLANEPVHTLDVQRYLGEWHEIAHLPMFFQRQCVDMITATYSKNSDGTLFVHNACRKKDGRIDVSDGIAKPVMGQPGALKVRFAPAWLAWLPWVWADYWVVDLDPSYQWAVVGSPTRKYLWVLSRQPSLNRDLFVQLRERARQRGYPVDQLIMSSPLH